MKENQLSAWRSLHYYDPSEVERRSKEATAVMMKMIGRPLPDWFR